MPIPRAAAVVIAEDRVLVIKRYLKLGEAENCAMCRCAGWAGPECRGHQYAVLPTS